MAAALTACSGGEKAVRAAAAPSPVPTSASPTPVPTKAVPVDPLTGLAPRPTGPVVVVKVDNAPLARPFHRGLGNAELVYQELVEGGATRLVAVDDDASAGEIGPIRSVREADLELLQPLGPVALAYSGGQSGVLAIVRRAVSAGRIQDAGYDRVTSIYRKGEQRRDARNFFTTPAKVAKARPKAGAARDIGLRFGPLVGGAPATGATVRFSPLSRVGLAFVAATGSWSLSQDGRPMPGVAPANVVVQRVSVRGSRFKDITGSTTPYTVTVGTGAVTVFRDGRAVTGTWKRPTAKAGTRLLGKDGRDIALKPGVTWILLVPTTGSLTTS